MARGLSDSMAALTINDDFSEWFWKGTNGNDLIRKLNSYARERNKPDRIRREKDSPSVYAIVLHNFPVGKSAGWKLVKVGFTHQSIKKGDNNRMEQLQKGIESELNKGKASQHKVKASILFVMRIGSVETASFHDTEVRIREKVGIPLKKEKANEFNLPVPTEWVLTTQENVDTIKQKLEATKAESTKDLIDAFEDIVAPKTLPRDLQSWV